MEVKNIDINKIIPYVNNPRNNKDAIDKVAASIKEFGFKVPIIIDKNNVIVTGHTRILAANKLGLNEVPCIVADDLTEAQIKAFRIADNRVSEFSEWDQELLKIELEGLKELDFNIELTGFELDDLELDAKEEQEYDEDNDIIEEPPIEPFSKRGDIWLLGKHRLMCGDSTNEDDVKVLMNGNKADMVFTDPPYGYNYQSNMRTKSNKFDVLKNDDKILDFMKPMQQVANGFIFICTTWKVLDKWIPLFNKYYSLTNMIIWDKGGGGIGDLKHTFSTDYEIILCSNNGKEITGKRIGSVWNIPKDNANDYVHATQKPIKLPLTAIENTTNKNNNVLDLFGGSGSTLMACEITNRINYSMELDEKYVDVIVKRYINHKQNNGEDVVLIRNGKEYKYSDISNKFNK